MDTPADLIRLALIALALGVAIPVLVQLFLTLRQAQKTIARLESRIDPALRDINQVIEHLKSPPPAPGAGAAQVLGAALIPAAIAAYKAFRAHSAETEPLKTPEKETAP